MPINPLNISLTPGVVAVPTKKTNSANWAETNLMRWNEDRMEPIGGFGKLNLSPFASRLMAIHRWTSNAGITIVAYLCVQHVYVDLGDGPVDISPVPAISPAPNPTQGGYGDNTYSLGSYGTPRPNKDPILVVPAVYTLDNWGEDLLIMTSNDGRLLRWKPSTPGVKATVVPNAPLSNRMFIVTPQRFVILFGAGGDFAKYQWCDEEDVENWTPSITSAAGDLNIQPAAPIITACKSGDEILMFTTNNDAYFIEYKGLPYIYGHSAFASESVPMSPEAIIDTPRGALWAASDGFWMFASGTAVSVPCPVWTWLSKYIDGVLARRMTNFVAVPTYSEVYLFFPSTGSDNCDRYVVWNFKNNWWAMGKLTRSCGVKSTFTGYPLMSDGYSVFQHESNDAYSLLPGEELPWARTFNINTAGGSMMTTVTRMVPDVDGDNASISFEMEYNIMRDGAAVGLTSGAKRVVKGIVGFDVTGRDLRMTIRQMVPQVSKWTFGNTILETVPRGRA